MTFQHRYLKSKETLLKDTSINDYNIKLFKKFFDWEEEKLRRQNGLPRLDESSYKTLCAYINYLKNVNGWFKNKAWNGLSQKEIKKVYNDLEDGKIVNCRGKRFEDRRSYYNKIFKSKPFKMAGLRDKVEDALEFFTDKKKKEVKFVTEAGFRQMLSFLQKPQHFALFWLAWDIGENISALLELRVKHFRRQINRDTGEAEYLVYLPEDTLKRSRKSRSEPTIHPETVRYLDALFKYGREVEYRDEKGRIRRKPIPFKDENRLFSFHYRQALQIFNSIVKRSGVTCEPDKEKPSWKDLRSGMACYLHSKGWHVEDINLRLGHSPQSRWLESYVNYLAVNRKKTIRSHYNNNLEDVKNEQEEGRKREKLLAQRLERQKKDFEELRMELDNLKSGKGFMKLLSQLATKEQDKSERLKKNSGMKFDIVLAK